MRCYFMDVAIQDVAQSPLEEGQSLEALSVMSLMSVLKQTPNGKEAWYNFEKKMRKKCHPGEREKAGEEALETAGVKVYNLKIVGHPNKMRAVLPQLVPKFLAVVGDKDYEKLGVDLAFI